MVELSKLLLLPYGVEQLLCEEGRIPESWVQKYYAGIRDARSEFDNASAWPKTVFQALHFASMYLPLRYNVWATSFGTSNHDTERLLGAIHLATEEYLWSSLYSADLPEPRERNDLLHQYESRLFDLCFGQISPAGVSDAESSFHSWKNAYEECLSLIKAELNSNERWPKRICMAVHFASFYLDLHQSQCIDLDTLALEVDDETLRIQIDGVLDTLNSRIENRGVLALIRLWLSSYAHRRNAKGLPTIAEPRPRTGQFVSVRTMSEIFIPEGAQRTRK